MSEEDDDVGGSISAQVGALSLEVQGDDREWVSKTFDEKLEDLLNEAETMSKAVRDGRREYL